MNKEVQIVVSAKDLASKAFNQVGQSADKMSGALGQINQKLNSIGNNLTMFATVPLLAASGAMIKFGMDAVESEDLFRRSMGKMSDSARKWSEELNKSLGLNDYEVRKNVATFNVMLESMGMTEKAAYDMSTGMTQLAYDMSSFYNLKPEEAFEKIRSGISGEIEPLKQLGVIVNETTVKNWALTHGMIKQGQELSESGKVMARYNVIMEATAKAHNNLADTIDSPANKTRILQEEIKKTATEIGVGLLPTYKALLDMASPVVKSISEMATWFSKLNPGIQQAAGYMVAFGISVGPAMSAVTNLATVFGPFLPEAAILLGLGLIVAALVKLGNEAEIAKRKLKLSETPVDKLSGKNLTDSISAEKEKLSVLYTRRDALAAETRKMTSGTVSKGLQMYVDRNMANLSDVNRQISDSENRLKRLEAKTKEVTSTTKSGSGPAYKPPDFSGIDFTVNKPEKSKKNKVEEQDYATWEAYQSAEKTMIRYTAYQEALEEQALQTAKALEEENEMLKQIDLNDTSVPITDDEILNPLDANAEYRKQIEDEYFGEGGAFSKTDDSIVSSSVLFVNSWRDAIDQTLENWGTWGDQASEITKRAAGAMQTALSDGFFNIVKGNFENLSDVVQNFLDSILRMLTDMMANAITKRFLSYFSGMFGGKMTMTAVDVDNIPQKAVGGPVSAGQTYLVGERGPELFTPGASGGITPNNQLGGVTIKSINVINNTGTQATAQTSTKLDTDGYVVNVILNAIATNKGGLRDALAR